MISMAFYFQFIEKILPCNLCNLQRIPHLIVIFVGFFYFFLSNNKKSLFIISFLAMSSSVLLSGYHILIEQNLILSPSSCNELIDTKKFNTEDLLSIINESPVISCKKVSWMLFGISMAGWNMIISIILSIYWFYKIKHDFSLLQK